MKKIRILAAAMLVLALTSFLATPLLEAQRRGGSFGGSRGGSRGGGFFRSSPSPSPSYAPNRPSSPSGSYSRPSTPATAPRTSFGGTRSGALSGSAGASAAQNYRRSYGVPRQSTPMAVPGSSTPYIVHSYGGFGGGYASGLMTGYLMGHTSAMWHTPFHPAFYYSRPTIIHNADGTIEAYPPTFSFFKLFLGLAIIGGIIWLVMRFIRSRRGNADMSQSSFG